MRRTRILATLGPASRDPATIRALLDAGVDAFRLNFSHGSAADHAETAHRVRAEARHAGRPVGILQDLGGPKIRVGSLDSPLTLRDGDSLTIERGDTPGRTGRVSCAFAPLFTSLAPGHRLLLDDGRIELEVKDASADRLATRVVSGGVLSSHKGINVPGVALRAPALTEKDAADLQAGVKMGVDCVALSFVQSADDVRMAKAAAAAAGAAAMPIVAKIEKPQAVDRIDEILQVADGLMIARGDLGIEVPLETLPGVQRRLVQSARRAGVPVILATQVLESMCSEPRPTRAEVTDAAHAVDEGVDVIMLSEETAVGQYPVRSAATLARIIEEAERDRSSLPEAASELRTLAGPADHSYAQALCEAAVALANRAGASAIVAVTETGKTPQMLAALRPSARILAATANPHVAARLSLVWGVTPILTDATSLAAVRTALQVRSLVPPATPVVFVSIHPSLGREHSNFVHVDQI